MSHKFRFENIDETRNYFVDGIEQNELMSSKHKKVCMTLNYIEQFLAFTVFTVLQLAFTECISISTFTFLLGIPIIISIPVIRLKIWAITAGIKKYKLAITKNKKKHNKTALLAKI